MNKVPVKIVWVKDINGKEHSSAMIAMEEMMRSVSAKDYSSVREFNREYKNLVDECRGIIKKQGIGNKISPRAYLNVGEALSRFVEENNANFKFINYRIAFQKDVGITDSYIGVIMDFPKFFNENEVNDGIPMSYYFELILKARSLIKIQKLECEKKKLIQMHDNRNLPDHKTYRKMLKAITSS